jgi:hypothetical protein
MTLKNLLGISLDVIQPDAATIGKLLAAIQTLTISVGVAPAQVIVLDALRKLGNLSDYSGDLIPDAVAAECLASAKALQGHVLVWLKAHRPDLLSG